MKKLSLLSAILMTHSLHSNDPFYENIKQKATALITMQNWFDPLRRLEVESAMQSLLTNNYFEIYNSLPPVKAFSKLENRMTFKEIATDLSEAIVDQTASNPLESSIMTHWRAKMLMHLFNSGLLDPSRRNERFENYVQMYNKKQERKSLFSRFTQWIAQSFQSEDPFYDTVKQEFKAEIKTLTLSNPNFHKLMMMLQKNGYVDLYESIMKPFIFNIIKPKIIFTLQDFYDLGIVINIEGKQIRSTVEKAIEEYHTARVLVDGINLAQGPKTQNVPIPSVIIEFFEELAKKKDPTRVEEKAVAILQFIKSKQQK